MSLLHDERGQSLLWVVIWIVGVMLALWVFTLLYGSVLEPIANIASGMQAVQDEGYGGHIDIVLATLKFSGLLLAVGSILLFIIFAVWRERFIGRTRRGPR